MATDWDIVGLEPVLALSMPLQADIWELEDLETPWRATRYTHGAFTIWSPITKKIHVIPKTRLGTDIMVIPPVAPNTGEKYVAVMLPVHGEMRLSYDESEMRMNEQYKFDFEKSWVTEVDISIDRRAVIRRKDEDEKGPDENRPGSAGEGDEGGREDS